MRKGILMYRGYIHKANTFKQFLFQQFKGIALKSQTNKNVSKILKS